MPNDKIQISEDVIAKFIDNLFGRIYKNQEDYVLRQIRGQEMDKNLKARIEKITKDAEQLKKDLKSGKVKITY